MLSARKKSNPSNIYSFPVGNRPIFWKYVLSWLRDNDIHVGTVNEADLVLGKYDVNT